MELQELEKSKMDVMKEIADSNVILSGLKADIKKLKEDKEEFFEKRRYELEYVLNGFLTSSGHLVTATEENYTHVHNFYVELADFGKEVKEQRDEIEKLIKDLNDNTINLSNIIARKTTELSEIRKGIDNDLRSIDTEKRFISSQKQAMTSERAKLNNQAREIHISLESLKRKKV